MARISVEDAARLGIAGYGDARTGSRGAKRSPALAPSVADASRLGTALRPGQRRKGGRIDLRLQQEPFLLEFSVPIEPKTKRRHRAAMPRKAIMEAFHRSRGNAAAFAAMLDGIAPHTHTDPETKAYEDVIRTAAAAAMRGRPPCRGQVSVSFRFFLAGAEHEVPTDVTDPDLDNLLKAAWDALNGTAWTDDRLVCRIGDGGVFKACSPEPRLEVAVRSVHPSPPSRAASGRGAEAEVALA